MSEVRAEMIEQLELADLSTTPSPHCSTVLGSRFFRDWLQEQRLSLAFTTSQTRKLSFVGRKPDRALSVFERTFHPCMGMITFNTAVAESIAVIQNL